LFIALKSKSESLLDYLSASVLLC